MLGIGLATSVATSEVASESWEDRWPLVLESGMVAVEVENQPGETETLLFTVVAPLGTIPPDGDRTASLDVYVVPVEHEPSPDRVEIALERTNAYGAWMLSATAAGPHAELTTIRDAQLFSDCDPTEQCVREVAVHLSVLGDVQADYAVRAGTKLGPNGL